MFGFEALMHNSESPERAKTKKNVYMPIQSSLLGKREFSLPISIAKSMTNENLRITYLVQRPSQDTHVILFV